MKTFAFGLLFSLFCSVSSAQYPYYGNPNDSLEIALQQMRWDASIIRNNLYSAGRPNPYRIEYPKDKPMYPSIPKKFRTVPEYKSLTQNLKYKHEGSKPKNNLKVYSIKDQIKLPKAKLGKPGELPKAHVIK